MADRVEGEHGSVPDVGTTLRRRRMSGVLAGVIPHVPWSEFVEASKRATAEAHPTEG